MPQSLMEERPTLSMMLSDIPEVRSLDALLYDAVLSTRDSFILCSSLGCSLNASR